VLKLKLKDNTNCTYARSDTFCHVIASPSAEGESNLTNALCATASADKPRGSNLREGRWDCHASLARTRGRKHRV